MIQTNQLSKREAEVVDLLLQGKSNKQIALALGISESTVEFHLQNIYAKLQVNSRVEALLKLGKSTGITAAKPGESIVDEGSVNNDNRGDLILVNHESMAFTSIKDISLLFGKFKIPIIIGILLAVILVYLLAKPTSWKKYERECEYPDIATVGQMIWRSNASGSKVHGQFGTAVSSPWPAQFGYVTYKAISTPQIDQLYLELRYSKNNPTTVPILIYLDDEPTPRASVYLWDLRNWDQFTWTEPIFLGKIESGVHSIKFSTEGQQYGVADLDKFVLSKKGP
jgi:DNA-binding CsgD family transcriptional regulator